MKFDYIKKFDMSEDRKRYIEKVLLTKQFYRNEDDIIVSEEYPENEQNSNSENNFDKNGFGIDKNRRHYTIIKKLCKQYYPFPKQVLEVGAGTGYFAKIFIDKFIPQKYAVYEFSKSFKIIRKKFKEERRTKVVIHNKSFKDLSSKELEQYDCVIALEVLEHINWDREFLSKIKPGTWVFISVPRIHGYNHVRAFLTPDSIAYRYRDILKIHEIKEVKRSINFKSKHNYPLIWAAACKKI